MPNAAPTRPSPTITRTRAGQPPRATNGASQARPPASARQRFCWELSACRQTSAAPAQANATGQNSCELMPSLLLCTIHNSPAPKRGQREQHAPVDPPGADGAGPACPARLADSRPGEATGRLRRQQQPEARRTPARRSAGRSTGRRNRSGSPSPASPDDGPVRCTLHPARRPRPPGWRAARLGRPGFQGPASRVRRGAAATRSAGRVARRSSGWSLDAARVGGGHDVPTLTRGGPDNQQGGPGDVPQRGHWGSSLMVRA